MTQKEKNIFRLSRAITNSLRGVASEKERGTLEQWLAASKKNREIYEGFKQGSYLEQKLSDYNAVNRLGDYERFITTRRKRTRFSIKTFVRYAAILILPLGLALVLLLREKQPEPVIAISEVITPGSHKAILTMGGGERIVLSDSTFTPLQEQNGMIVKIQNSKVSYLTPTDTLISETTPIYNTLQVPRGGEYFLTLSDGTQVWLNAESEIRYPVRFTGSKREIFLEGEAFLTVTPNKEKPFVVVSSKASVTVLGTEFNFRAYPDEENVQTTLVEGSVIMQSARYKQQIRLIPGEQGTLEIETGKLYKQEVNTYLYTAWKDGRFAFRNTRLEELFNILSRWYDLHVFYLNPEAKDIRFTGDINKTEDFNAILKIIENNERVIFNVNKRTVSVQLK
ncbi:MULTISPECIES: FecR family protein [Butyricimonas]|uniref:FecR family protein n=1 Tax=Butyricimonas TaxID=574697 RepID=UPI001D05F7CF|nr:MULTISPECIES: FecR domain-containing protein [Butyricimonas]MCB6974457.1 FecR domain-containing protein [Butyricimonas synergistica]MCG4521179.1 FecR domain-containing protein [Butyricimonas sp. DFI.6.44]